MSTGLLDENGPVPAERFYDECPSAEGLLDFLVVGSPEELLVLANTIDYRRAHDDLASPLWEYGPLVREIARCRATQGLRSADASCRGGERETLYRLRGGFHAQGGV